MDRNSQRPTFQEAIEIGEYTPEFLSLYQEFQILSRAGQFEYIQRALNNRRRQLYKQYAEISSVLNFSKKPQAQAALKQIEQKVADLAKERERLFIEYAGV